jgi:hypothetical protein
MSKEISHITQYGINSIKKFEWATAYQAARPQTMSETNIKSAFKAASLIPFNRRKVLARMSDFTEEDCNSASESDIERSNSPPVSKPHPFTLIPATPSRVDPTTLIQASKLLVTNIEAGILDTPTKNFVPKLASYVEYMSSQLSAVSIENQAIENILKNRREVTMGK